MSSDNAQQRSQQRCHYRGAQLCGIHADQHGHHEQHGPLPQGKIRRRQYEYDGTGKRADHDAGVSTWHHAHYRRAVYSITKASLTEHYRDIDTTRDGEKHAEALSTQIDMLWRDARWSIRDILGEDRGLAELV